MNTISNSNVSFLEEMHATTEEKFQELEPSELELVSGGNPCHKPEQTFGAHDTYSLCRQRSAQSLDD